MTGETERVGLHVLLAYRRRDEDVDLPGLQGGHGGIEGLDGALARFGSGDSGSDMTNLAADIDDADAPVGSLRGGERLVEPRALEREGGSPFGSGARAAVDHGSAELGHRLVGQSLEYDLISDAVEITVGNTHLYLFSHKDDSIK